jgi:hypothetical protein
LPTGRESHLRHGPGDGGCFDGPGPIFCKIAEEVQGARREAFNSIADSHDEFLSLKPMHEMVVVGAQNRMVAAGPGLTYGQIAPFLENKGLALHNPLRFRTSQ